MNGLQIFNIIILVALLGYGLYWLFRFFQRKNASKVLTPEEFAEIASALRE